MKVLIVLSAVLAAALAKPGYFAGGIPAPYAAHYAAHIGAPLPYSSLVAAPAVISEQHHAQDAFGQYKYGYSDGLSTKGEFRTADGVTRGAYAYVDGEGKVQNVAYTADAAGFRVSASNLPVAPAVPEAPALESPEPVQDTAEVVAARAAHEVAVKEAEIRAAEPVPAPAPEVVPSDPSVISAPAISYSSLGVPAFGFSSLAAPAIGYSAIAPGSGFAYSSIHAAPAYSAVASAPAISYSAFGVPAVSVIPEAGVPVLTPAGVPVDTPEVQAARAADVAAHLRAKGLIF